MQLRNKYMRSSRLPLTRAKPGDALRCLLCIRHACVDQYIFDQRWTLLAFFTDKAPENALATHYSLIDVKITQVNVSHVPSPEYASSS